MTEQTGETAQGELPMTEGGVLDVQALNPQERVSYILEVRRRVNEGETVPDDDIRDAVRCIRVGRAETPRGKKKKDEAPAVSLSDF